MFKVCLLAALAIVGAAASPDDFKAWMTKHGKSYSAAEMRERYTVWMQNKQFVDTFKGEHQVAMNEYGDLTKAEFAKYYLGLAQTVEYTGTHGKASTGPVGAPVDTVNWVTKGAVTGVKNQGQCGSCWSFSTTGSTEGCHEISGKSLVGLSEQNLVDCSTSYGNQGCNGGLMTQAMEYIINNKGIDSEASYPYTATGPNQCQFNRANVAATLSSYTNVQSGNEQDLTSKINSGPVSVGIDASHSSFQFYSGGVYYEPDCSSTQLDHGVLAAGYGTDSGKDFYLVKNSWGASWGLQGYIMMSRNRNNNCGIATSATLPHC